MSKSSGFTLIELLITISIIAVLSAIGLVVFSSVIKQGRDSKRQSDLRSIQSALEQYFADQFSYPSGLNNTNSYGYINISSLTSGSKTYLNQMPADPLNILQNNRDYRYFYIALTSSGGLCENSPPEKKCARYCLYDSLENTADSFANNCSANALLGEGKFHYSLSSP